MKSLGNTVIFGDSYSTYEGYIPEVYAIYYTKSQRSDSAYLDSVQKTWWKMLLDETDSNLVLNNSWSGSTVCYTGYLGVDKNQSFVKRARECLIDGVCNSKKVDTVLIFGGTNDNWANSPLGSEKYENITEKDLESFFPALCYLITYIKNSSKDIRIINITNTELREEVTSGMASICEHLGVENVVLHGIEKDYGHPNEKGMEQIKNQILEKCL